MEDGVSATDSALNAQVGPFAPSSVRGALAISASRTASPGNSGPTRADRNEASDIPETDASRGQRVRPPPLKPQERTARTPLSISQQLWYDPTVAGDGPPELRCAAPTFRLVGAFNPSAMVLALNQLIERHEILRTHYGHDANGSYQEVQEVADPRLSWIDLSGHPGPLVRPTLTAMMRASYAQPADLERHGPFQSWLFKLRSGIWILALVVDHIALDNRSVQLLASEIFGNYRRNCAGLTDLRPPLALQYRDYAIWAQSTDAADRLRANTEFWRDRIGGTKPANLRQSGDWTDVRSSSRRATRFSVSTEVTRMAQARAREQGVTVPILVVAAIMVLLGSWAREEKVLTGFVVQRRPQQMRDAIGAFVRNAPLFMDLSGDPTGLTLIARARRAYLEANDPAKAILPKTIPQLGQVLLNIQTKTDLQLDASIRSMAATPEGSAGAADGDPPPDQGTTLVEDGPELPFEPAPGLSVSRWNWAGRLLNEARLDLHILVTQDPSSLNGLLLYAADRLDVEAVREFTARAPHLFRALVERPEMPLSQLFARVAELEEPETEPERLDADAST